MANVKWSAFSSGSAIADADTAVGVQSGANVKWAWSAIKTYIYGAATAVLSIASGKTFTVSNTLTLAGTDSTIMTFPTTSATVARTDAANTFTGTQSFSGTTTFTVAASGPILKQGANGRVGTFVANGVTPVTVSNTSIAITDAIIISLNAVGGTVGAHPTIQTITASTGFTVAATALDTSTYNYAILKNA